MQIMISLEFDQDYEEIDKIKSDFFACGYDIIKRQSIVLKKFECNDSSFVGSIISLLSSFDAKAFSLNVSKLGVFPSISEPKYLYVMSNDTRENIDLNILRKRILSHLEIDYNDEEYNCCIKLVKHSKISNKREFIKLLTNYWFKCFEIIINSIVIEKVEFVGGKCVYTKLYEQRLIFK